MIKRLLEHLCLRKAKALSVRREFSDARAELGRIFLTYGEGGPSSKSPLAVNVFFADLSLRVHEERAAFDACVVSLKQIETLLAKRKDAYRQETAKYLALNCKWILSSLAGELSTSAMSIAGNIDVKYNSIKLESVGKFYRRLFPVSPENGAKLDAMFG